MALLKWRIGNTWKTLYGDILNNVLGKDKNLSDLTDKIKARENLELTGDNNPTHAHNQLYYTKNDVERLIANQAPVDKTITVSGKASGSGIDYHDKNTITVNIDSIAATSDKNGNDIPSTYIKSITANNNQITYTKGNGAANTISVGSDFNTSSVISFSGSTQGDTNPGIGVSIPVGGTVGEQVKVDVTTMNTRSGIPAGNYTLQQILQLLINMSHRHENAGMSSTGTSTTVAVSNGCWASDGCGDTGCGDGGCGG